MIIRVMMSKAKRGYLQHIYLCNFKTGTERLAHLRGEDEVEFGGQAETRLPETKIIKHRHALVPKLGRFFVDVLI